MRRAKNQSKTCMAGLLALALLTTIMSTSAGAGVDSITTPDPTSIPQGDGLSMVLDEDGNPVVAWYDPHEESVRILHCNDPACAGGDDVVTSRGWGGQNPSIAVDSNNIPVVASVNEKDLVFWVCNDPYCLPNYGSQRLDDIGEDAIGTALMLDEDDVPTIAYADKAGRLTVMRCEDPRCQGDKTTTLVHQGAQLNTPPTMQLDALGNPILTYTTRYGRLFVLHCNDPACAGEDEQRASYLSPDYAIGLPSLALRTTSEGDTEIAIAAISIDPETFATELQMFTCATTCTGALRQLDAPSTNGNEPFFPSLALTENGPVVAYAALTENNVHVEVSSPTDAGPADPWRVVAPDPFTDGYHFPNIKIDDTGQATVASISSDGLKVIRCDDVGCVPTCNNLPVTVDIGAGGKARPNAAEVIRGTIGDDTIIGSSAGDIICGLGGDDTIDGGGGWDRIFAGAGNDTVDGGGGWDRIVGGPGNDLLFGGTGEDRILGGGGNDTMHGGADNDHLSGGGGNDIMHGNLGDDLILGNLGSDRIEGGRDNDIIKGGAWIDTVDGGDGDDDRCGIVEGEIRVNCERGVFGI